MVHGVIGVLGSVISHVELVVVQAGQERATIHLLNTVGQDVALMLKKMLLTHVIQNQLYVQVSYRRIFCES